MRPSRFLTSAHWRPPVPTKHVIRVGSAENQGLYIATTGGPWVTQVQCILTGTMSPSLNEPERLNRQAQGLACNECRARKLRCDRVRPTCGTCESLGVTCTPNSVRQPRGPRKGYLKTLQSRICKNRIPSFLLVLPEQD